MSTLDLKRRPELRTKMQKQTVRSQLDGLLIETGGKRGRKTVNPDEDDNSVLDKTELEFLQSIAGTEKQRI